MLNKKNEVKRRRSLNKNEHGMANLKDASRGLLSSEFSEEWSGISMDSTGTW